MNKNLYIVPYDFTAVGDAALNYALYLGNKVEVEIIILYIAKSTSDAVQATAKLTQLISTLQPPASVNLSHVVKEGSIFEDIASVALKKNAQLVIMGTHGATGLQKLMGSNAMKVILSSEIPFLIVQKDTLPKSINEIVVPIDLTKESLQIVNLAGDMASIYGATVHVIGEKQNDELLSQQMKNRILIVKNQYDERKVKSEVEFMPRGGSYQKKIMNYCAQKQIDLIAIAYHSESLLPQFDTFAQSLITNDQKIPCLILKSKLASALYF
jgi:nucleotide-binding universal stress UspA family protein